MTDCWDIGLIEANHVTNYNYGKKKEKQIRPLLNRYFDDKLRQTSTFCPWDFVGCTGVTYEVKSRKISSKHWRETILAVNKIKPNVLTQYFIFNFTDRIMYIKYDPNIFAFFRREITGSIEPSSGRQKVYFKIPIDALTEMTL